jgi:hypothetical protein
MSVRSMIPFRLSASALIANWHRVIEKVRDPYRPELQALAQSGMPSTVPWRKAAFPLTSTTTFGPRSVCEAYPSRVMTPPLSRPVK